MRRDTIGSTALTRRFFVSSTYKFHDEYRQHWELLDYQHRPCDERQQLSRQIHNGLARKVHRWRGSYQCVDWSKSHMASTSFCLHTYSWRVAWHAEHRSTATAQSKRDDGNLLNIVVVRVKKAIKEEIHDRHVSLPLPRQVIDVAINEECSSRLATRPTEKQIALGLRSSRGRHTRRCLTRKKKILLGPTTSRQHWWWSSDPKANERKREKERESDENKRISERERDINALLFIEYETSKTRLFVDICYST